MHVSNTTVLCIERCISPIQQSYANSAYLGAWASSLHNLQNRNNSLHLVCDSLLSDTYQDGHSIANHLANALKDVQKASKSVEKLVPSLDDLQNHPKKLQSEVQSILKEKQFQHFLDTTCQSERDRSRIISCGGPNAGCWLDAIPSSQHFTLSSAEFSTATLMRLGKAIPALRKLEKCVEECNKSMDNEGYHALTCKCGGGAITRHDRVLDTVYNMMRELDFRCRKELQDQFKGKHRPDIAVYDYKDGKKLLLDITITHPWAQLNISGSNITAGYSTLQAEKGKNKKYLQISSDLGYLFKPVAFEVYGRWGEQARELLNDVATLAPPILNLSTSEFKHLWRRKIAVCLQKQSALIIKNKVAAIVGKGSTSDIIINSKQQVRCFGTDFG